MRKTLINKAVAHDVATAIEGAKLQAQMTPAERKEYKKRFWARIRAIAK